jgi:hypothetical protein
MAWISAHLMEVIALVAGLILAWVKRDDIKAAVSSKKATKSSKAVETEDDPNFLEDLKEKLIHGDIHEFLAAAKDDIERTLMVNLLLRFRHKVEAMEDGPEKDQGLEAVNTLLRVVTQTAVVTTLQDVNSDLVKVPVK